ncbi:hypothetical protein DEF23_22480 [Marinitenerispora sediminis]|uniref:Uncharacterized protein n=1 Tax=Marinitenerispora sediminis TaxID=1931232 RepID=A0A368T1M7_9ACTN|nr:hypothetical protein DEF23_22480 [Marinitenerispora sediminis]RCV54529.1 hypothetical protein DEF24_19145 [Marinitenerispora sediminis]RCV56956.1 hypothetical protein DEF28_02445 [Marinitenerispora sediminis]
MRVELDGHPIEPDYPWPRSPTNVLIRCNVCMGLRYFADQHADHLDDYSPGPHCKTCGKRIEFRCTGCDSPWQPLS